MTIQTIKEQIEALDPEIHGSLRRALVIHFCPDKRQTNNRNAETDSRSDRLAEIFGKKVDELNKCLPDGTVPFIRKHHPDLYQRTNEIEFRLNEIWKRGLRGDATIGEFEDILNEWFDAYLNARNVYLRAKGTQTCVGVRHV